MYNSFKGVNIMKNILITGASRGLGFNLTRRYLEFGETVFAGARNENAANLIKLKEKYGDRLHIIKLDVASTESVNSAKDAVSKATDSLDYIINNAGIHCDTSFEPLETTNLDDAVEVYNVNSIGPLRVIKAFLPIVKSRIINISSESGSIGICGREKEFDYCMSKAALNMASKQIQNKVKNDDIKVLAVQPGWMRTQAADFDPYEQACVLVDMFEKACEKIDSPIFVDFNGDEMPW